MYEWWGSLDPLTHTFFLAAFGLSVVFVLQMLAALFGLAHHGGDFGAADGHGDAVESGAAVDSNVGFQLVSVRSVIAFLLLFSWAAAFYLMKHWSVTPALLVAVFWGLGAMFAVAGVYYFIRRMTEIGSPRLATCVGLVASVYQDIPAGGVGNIRTLVSGVITLVDARSVGPEPLKGGTSVRVRRVLGPTLVEVEKVTE
jgi:hypothetical protein